MPTTAITATATTTHQLKLAPQLKKKLILAMQTYTELALTKKAIKVAQAKQTKIVEDIQVELGETSIDIDGYKSTIVAPIRHILDRKQYVALGGDLELLDKAMIESPGKSYLRITPPGAERESDD